MATKRVPKKIKKIVQGYVKKLSKEGKLPIKKVIIFGSRVKGKSNKWSDIDVCIVSTKFKDSLKALDFLWSKRSDEEVRQGLEPVGFSIRDFQEGNSLIQEIKKTGYILI